MAGSLAYSDMQRRDTKREYRFASLLCTALYLFFFICKHFFLVVSYNYMHIGR